MKAGKTPTEVRDEFRRKGISISRWAVENRLQPQTVFNLLSGHCRGLRGDAHRAAVLLGIQDGETVARAGAPRTHLSAAELAGTPGMPKSERGVQKRAAREGWIYRKRRGRGGGREYDVRSLPETTRRYIK